MVINYYYYSYYYLSKLWHESFFFILYLAILYMSRCSVKNVNYILIHRKNKSKKEEASLSNIYSKFHVDMLCLKNLHIC